MLLGCWLTFDLGSEIHFIVKFPERQDINIEEVFEGFSEWESFPQSGLLGFCNV